MRSTNPWYESLKKLTRSKTAIVCVFFIVFISIVALFAKQISPYPFDEQNLDRMSEPPSLTHWLGTDGLGRDLLSRLIYGSRISMAVGVIASLISLILGLIYGVISGWIGGKVDALMMRGIDILYSIPHLVLIILMKIIFDSTMHIENSEIRSLISIVAALSIVGWLTLGRVVRGEVLQVKTALYVESAKALGASGKKIVIKQILPNIIAPVIVLLTIQIPTNIISESILSFIGLGLRPPYSSWGILANEGWQTLKDYPHLMIAPGVALFMTTLAFNFLGDALTDAIEPTQN